MQHLATYAYKSNSSEKKELTYNDLADCVENCETFQFLAGLYISITIKYEEKNPFSGKHG